MKSPKLNTLTLREALENRSPVTERVNLWLAEPDFNYQTDNGWGLITNPLKFSPYADCKVTHIIEDHGEMTIVVEASPDDGICEVFYTGGGIWCAICQLDDGTWFSAEVNGWGCIWSSYSAALEAFPYPENGLVRYVTDADEQREIWEHIYHRIINEGEPFYADHCREWLEQLQSKQF